MVKHVDTEIIPKNSTRKQTKKESSEPLTQKIEKDKKVEIISKGNRDETPEEQEPKKWKELGFHAASVLTIGGTGTLFHFLHAPAEVTVLILIIEVIFVGQIYKLFSR